MWTILASTRWYSQIDDRVYLGMLPHDLLNPVSHLYHGKFCLQCAHTFGQFARYQTNTYFAILALTGRPARERSGELDGRGRRTRGWIRQGVDLIRKSNWPMTSSQSSLSFPSWASWTRKSRPPTHRAVWHRATASANSGPFLAIQGTASPGGGGEGCGMHKGSIW